MSAVLAKRLDAYAAVTRIGFLGPLAFRLFPFMMVISYPIIMTGNYFFYRAIYTSHGNSPIAGLSGDQAITYMLVGWTVRSFYKNPISRMIGERVKSGEIATDLIKPIDFFGLYFCQGFGRGLHRMVFISGPLALLVLISHKVPIPASPVTWVVFLLSALGGFLINYCMAYLSGIMAFFFEYNDGLDWIVDLLTKLLGGLMLPLSFFPDKIAAVLKFLPFAGLYYQPAYIFLGKIAGIDAWHAVGFEFLWVLGLLAVGQFFLGMGRHKLLLQGG